MKNFFTKLSQDLRYDLPASIVVLFVALPLCLGIALASGVPLFSGIISGIIGGVVVGIASGSRFGVSGPAAGLVTIVLTYSLSLGSFESFLVATILAGIIQTVMGYMRLGTIAYYIPTSVIKGMLAGIGIIIVIKQIPHALGYDHEVPGNFEFLSQGSMFNLEDALFYLTPAVTMISIISMTILVLWDGILSRRHNFFKMLQGPIVIVAAGILMNSAMQLEAHHIVQIPIIKSFSELFSLFIFPNLEALKNPQVYEVALILAITASVETLLSVEAIDKLDPAKHVTNTNRELKAQGLGNIIAGLIGGLPITQVIVRSSANLSFGAKTKKSTILHGLLLMIAVISVPKFLNMIPLASLACILLVLGYKLAKPTIFKKVYHSGWHDFLPFLATVIGVVGLDLLKGVGIGIVIALICRAKKSDEASLTQEERDSITPEVAVKLLKEGNQRFVQNLKVNRNLLKQVNDTSKTQNPFAFVLSCIDSRTSAELIFDQGLGDIFSCRIAGNVLNDDIVGSMEFACQIAGTKLIMVLGHSECGAIKGACNDVEMGKFTGLLKKIKPSVKAAKLIKGNKKFHDLDFVDKVGAINVERVAKQITKESKIIHDLEKKGKIVIISGMYDVATGVVDFY
ncbi:MAG: SulP family inorganic anion transporter [Proteobacteria bacterium]|nr:SulP family inorganic anion transporter [Pseudomonadota bacterium]